MADRRPVRSNASVRRSRSAKIRGEVRVTHLFSGVPTADLPSALRWWERLIGRPPDRRPNDDEAVWQLAESGLIYVVRDPARAGQALLTLIIEDLDGQLAELRQRDIEVGPTETYGGGARKATITDPDGNRIAFGEVPPPRSHV